MSSKVTVVIIGASFAGAPIAHALLKDSSLSVKVILLNPSPTFYFAIAAPRIFAKPEAFQPEQYLIPIEPAFGSYPADSFEFVQGRATTIAIEEQTVTVDGERAIQFDYLVIASGSTTASTILKDGVPFPFKQSDIDNMRDLVRNAQNAVSDARSVVIAGSGPIGVEVAGEIAEAAEESGAATSITLVSATERVLSMLKKSGSDVAEKMLAAKNVKVLKSRKVTGAVFLAESNTWDISLDNGEHLTADVYIPATGVLPNNNFVPKELLDESGWVKVNNELRVQGAKGASVPIYAAGDITNNSMRLGFKATEQSGVVAANLKADILGSGKRRTYDQGTSVMMMVPIGASGGTGQVFGLTLWSFLVRLMKGKDFFVPKAAQAISAN